TTPRDRGPCRCTQCCRTRPSPGWPPTEGATDPLPGHQAGNPHHQNTGDRKMNENTTQDPQQAGDPETQPQPGGLRAAAHVAGKAVDTGVVIGYGLIYTVLLIASAVVAFAAPGGM